MLRWIGAAVSIGLVGRVLAYLIGASHLGFNVTDEGYYLLAARFPEDVTAWPNAAHVYLAPLFRLVGMDVVTFRLVGLAMAVGGALVLATGLGRLLVGLGMSAARDVAGWLAAAAMITSGVLLYYNLRLFTPSFNLVTAAALNVAGGCVCWGLATADRQSWPRRPWSLAVAGVALGVAFFAKFSSGISATVLVITMLAAWPVGTRRDRARAVSMLLAGVLAWTALHFTVLQGPVTWWRMISDGIAWLRVAAPWVGMGAVPRNLEALGALVSAGVGQVAGLSLLLLGGMTALAFVRGPWGPRAQTAWLVGALLGCAALAYRSDLHRQGGVFGDRYADQYAAWVVLLLVAAAATAIARRLADGCWPPLVSPPLASRRVVLLALLLAALPVAGAIGTADRLTIAMMWYLGPAFGLLVVLLRWLTTWHASPAPYAFGSVLVVLIACTQVVARGEVPLYHYPQPMRAHTTPTVVGTPATRLMLPAAQSVAVRRLRRMAAAHGFEPGDDVLAFYNYPGLVYALGGRSPGTPWYLWRIALGPHQRNASQAAGIVLSTLDPARLRRAFILTSVAGMPAFPDLAALGLRFPEDYVRCGAVSVPTGFRLPVRVELWKPIRVSEGPDRSGPRRAVRRGSRAATARPGDPGGRRSPAMGPVPGG